MDLVTGHAGTNHVSAADIACMLRCMYGETDGVYDVDGKMACSVVDSNTVEIATGACSTQGYFSRIDIAEQLPIDSGTPGYKRNDLVVARYELGEGNVQSMTLAIVKGMPTTQSEATDPDIAEGTIDGGDVLVEFAIWRVPIDGTSVGTPERVLPLLTSANAAISTLRDSVGTYLETFNGTNSIPKASDTTCRSLSLQNGVWVVATSGAWSSNFSNVVVMRIKLDGATKAVRRSTGQYGGDLFIATVIEVTNGPKDASLSLYQESSSAQSIASDSVLKAVRIA